MGPERDVQRTERADWGWSSDSSGGLLNRINNDLSPWLESAGFVSFGTTADTVLSVVGGVSSLYTVYQVNNAANQVQQAANQDLNNPVYSASPDTEQYTNDQINSDMNYAQYEVNPLSAL